MWGEVYEPLADDQSQTTPIFVENGQKRSFSIISKTNTYDFNQEMVSTRNPRILHMAKKHIWGEVYEPLASDQWSHNPHFL
jgi:hypothetical protein